MWCRPLVLLCLALLLAGCAGEGTDPRVSAAERDAAIAAAERDAAAARLEASEAAAAAAERDRWRPARTAALSIAQIAAALTVPLALAGAVLYGLKRRAVWMPRKADGALPFPATVDVTDSRAALAGRLATEHALAEASANVPHTITWSPRSDYRNHSENIPDAEPAPLTAYQVVAFRDVAVTPHAVHLGTSADGPVIRPWDQMRSLLVAGQTRSGKSHTASSLVLQGMAAGQRVVLCDPHSANRESLASRLAPVHDRLWRPVATTDAEIADAAAEVEQVMRDRAEGRDHDLTPVTFVLDEMSKVMRGDLAKVIARILEGVAQEGVKFGVRAVLLAQRGSASRMGGSGDLRDTIPDVLLHTMRRIDARMLSGWALDDLPDTSTLAPGECFLLADEEVVRVSQPVMSPGDVAAFAAGLAAGQGLDQGSVQPAAPPEVGPGSGPKLDEGVDGGAGPTSDLRKRVRAMYLQGCDLAAVTDAVSGVRDRSSGTWKRTRRQVEEALRAELGEGGFT